MSVEKHWQRVAIAACVAMCLSSSAISVSLASNSQSPLARALHDTNTVRTLQHYDVSTAVSGSVTVHSAIRGAEDEVRNRERDSETVTITGPGPNGKFKKVHYTAEVIFVNGHTYYRTSLDHNTWHKHAGTTFVDRLSGIEFKRARTQLSFASSVHFKLVGQPKGRARFRATIPKSGATDDLLISTGRTPYVLGQTVRVPAKKGNKVHGVTRTTYGPFNKSLIILAPSSQGQA
ncbi:MAG: hypothetical protein ACRDFS_08705 [Chloroflexota bacterium]